MFNFNLITTKLKLSHEVQLIDFKKEVWETKKQVSNSLHVVLLQMTWVQCQKPTLGRPRWSDALSWSMWHLHSCSYTHTEIQINSKLEIIRRNKTTELSWQAQDLLENVLTNLALSTYANEQ